jgi:hypothetical protein
MANHTYSTFKAQWLRERMGHVWTNTSPTVCMHCGAKYSARTGPQVCRKRRKPNRWKVHAHRAYIRAQCGQKPVKRDGTFILTQIQDLERNAKQQLYDSRGTARGAYVRIEDEQRWWKYSRDARRYRKLLSAYWALPTHELPPATGGASWPSSAWLTRGRRQLLKEAKQKQVRTLHKDGCVYTFYPHARDDQGALIFQEE